MIKKCDRKLCIRLYLKISEQMSQEFQLTGILDSNSKYVKIYL
jgi:hypothetical protein